MTRRILLVVLLLVALVVPAWAEETPETAEPLTLDQLVTLVEREIELIESHDPLLPSRDNQARIEAHLARLDFFIGSIRVAAEKLLAPEIGHTASSVVVDIPGDIDVAGITTTILDADLDAITTWRAEREAQEWVEIAAAIDRLRKVAGDRVPTRVCPVQGDVWFTNNWGDDRPGGRSHKGIDLMGPRGVPVQAIEDGVVVQANWHWQGGRQIWVRADSTGDVYYYAHLDYWEKWIWTGTRVEAGDVMGTLGSSGNADGPHVHFGWMPGSSRVDIENFQNPYPLLREICEWHEPPSWFVYPED